MRHEYSCGAVLFTRVKGRTFYVLVTEKNGSCGLPKGHMEAGETERETALREIFEETGVHAEIVGDFRHSIDYHKNVNVTKHVTYFLAEYSGQEVKYTGEVRSARAMPLTRALSAITYAESRRILRLAADEIEK